MLPPLWLSLQAFALCFAPALLTQQGRGQRAHLLSLSPKGALEFAGGERLEDQDLWSAAGCGQTTASRGEMEPQLRWLQWGRGCTEVGLGNLGREAALRQAGSWFCRLVCMSHTCSLEGLPEQVQ